MPQLYLLRGARENNKKCAFAREKCDRDVLSHMGQTQSSYPSLISRSPKIPDFHSKFYFLINLRGLPHGLELFADVLTGFRVFLHIFVIFSEWGTRKKYKMSSGERKV